MAIRFVDVEPEKGEGAEAPQRRARAPAPAPRAEPNGGAGRDPVFDTPPDAAPDAVEAGSADAPHEAPPSPLPHAKPEPKPRGRKKPMSAVGADKAKGQAEKGQSAPDVPSAPLLDGLLPELQVHAKPTPKPRGRKKAFG